MRYHYNSEYSTEINAMSEITSDTEWFATVWGKQASDDSEEKKESSNQEKAEKTDDKEKKENAKQKEKEEKKASLDATARVGMEVLEQGANMFNRNRLNSAKPIHPTQQKNSNPKTPLAKIASDHSELARLLVEHPKASLLGALGAVGGAAALGGGINLLAASLAKSRATNQTPDSYAVQHPYLTNIAGGLASGVASRIPGVGMVLGPLGNLATAVESTAGAEPFAKQIEKGHGEAPNDGFLANYSYKHPHLGPLASAFIPGAHSVNSAIAARQIQNTAEKERNFTYRHPVLSTMAHGLIPGSGLNYALAAQEIAKTKEKGASARSDSLKALASAVQENPKAMALAAGLLYGGYQAKNALKAKGSYHLADKIMHNSVTPISPYVHDFLSRVHRGWSNSLRGAGDGTLAGILGASGFGQELMARTTANHLIKNKKLDDKLTRAVAKRPRLLATLLNDATPVVGYTATTAAGHAIGEEAIAKKNFTYRHPHLSTILHGLVPGHATAYATAGSKVNEYKRLKGVK